MAPRNRSRRGPHSEDEAPAEDEDPIRVEDEDGNQIDDNAHVEVEPEIEEAEPTPAARAEPAADDPFQVLQREADAAKAALAAERKRSADLEARVHTSGADIDATNAALLKHAAAAARGEVDAAEAAYATAMAAADYPAAAAAQRLLTEKIADAREYEAASVEFERVATERKATPPARTQPAPAAATDPAEAIIGQMTPASGAWLRKNKDVALKSQAAWSRTIAAHHSAIEAGHEVDSPAYFQFLEGDLKITGGRDPTPITKPTPKRAPPMAAAPVNKGTPAAGGVSVRLSMAERDAAKRMGMTVAKYASLKHKAHEAAKDPEYAGPRYSQDNPAITGRR